jgi:hypothetical protein
MTRIEEIKAFRNANQCGIAEAMRHIDYRDKLRRLVALQHRTIAATSIESLACILREVIEEMMLEVSFS